MTLGEMCLFYEQKNEHYPVSDEFIKKVTARNKVDILGMPVKQVI